MTVADQQKLDELIGSAQAALREADFGNAVALFGSVLALDPRHVLANYWVGALARKAGLPEQAVPYLEAAATLDPSAPETNLELGLALRAIGQADRAEACLEKARVAAHGQNAAYLAAAEAQVQQGASSEALETYRRGLTLFPNDRDLLERLADLLQRLGSWEEANDLWQRRLRLTPESAPAWVAYGVSAHKAGQLAVAEAAFRQALVVDPAYLPALLNLGVTLQKTGRPREALPAFLRAAASDPENPDAHKAVGDVLRELNHWDEAIVAWHKAVTLRPNYADAWQNLGLALEHQGRLREAQACHQKTIELNPQDPNALRYFGMVSQDLGQFDVTAEAYRRALAVDPRDAEVHWQKFYLQALRGDFPAAWEEYEWRWLIKNNTTPKHDFTQPKWQGEPLAGRTLLLHTEQGFGETIQAVRFVEWAAAQGGRVLLWCPPELVTLLRSTPGVTAVLAQLTAKVIFDVHAPLMDLPRLYRADFTNLPRRVPYLRAPANAGPRLPPANPRALRVGLVWSGSLSQEHDRRPIPFARLLPLLGLNGMEFYSLQKGDAARDAAAPEAAGRVVDLGAGLTDFGATAAVIEQLDLILTIDTSVAHLVGALGKPVWLLLSFAPDWRWLRDRADNPWYPTMTLFRQTQPGDWAGVISRVGASLASWSAAGLSKSAIMWVNWLTEGVACHQQGRLDDAERLYARVIEHEPRQADALRLSGIALRQRGRHEAAARRLQESLAVAPNVAATHHDLGLTWFEMGRLDEAIAAYQRAIALSPVFPEAHYNLGNAFYAVGRRTEAAAGYRTAAEQNPALPEAHYNLGLLAHESGDQPAALGHYRRALELRPTYPDALMNLAVVLKESRQPDEAGEYLLRLLRLDPGHLKGRVNLGAVKAMRREFAEARRLLEEVVRENPNVSEAWSSLGVVRQAEGDPAAAIVCFERALAGRPDHPEATFNLGIAQLLSGRLEAGWRNYEARWRTGNPIFAPRGFPAPLWQGEPLAGRTVLVHAEQGLGDAIQFIRYAAALAQRGARVVVECPAPLLTLLETAEGVAAVVARGQPDPGCDWQSPLLSLPLRFGTTLETIPGRVPYLRAPANATGSLPPTPNARLKVGLVWSGSRNQPSDQRPIPFALLAPLLRQEGAAFFSLQVGEAAADARSTADGPRPFDLSGQLTDLGATAAVMQALDLIITIDTAPAHLAGALGKQVWILLPFAPDWRWLLGRDDSPWYPTAWLYRQPAPGDWAPVAARLARDLAALLK